MHERVSQSRKDQKKLEREDEYLVYWGIYMSGGPGCKKRAKRDSYEGRSQDAPKRRLGRSPGEIADSIASFRVDPPTPIDQELQSTDMMIAPKLKYSPKKQQSLEPRARSQDSPPAS